MGLYVCIYVYVGMLMPHLCTYMSMLCGDMFLIIIHCPSPALHPFLPSLSPCFIFYFFPNWVSTS